MPSIIGRIDSEQEEFIDDELVENGPYENRSEAVNHLITYALFNKYGLETEE